MCVCVCCVSAWVCVCVCVSAQDRLSQFWKCVCVRWSERIYVMWLGPSARFPHRCWPNTQVSDAAHSSSGVCIRIRISGKPHKYSLVQLIFWRESASVGLTRLEQTGPRRLSNLFLVWTGAHEETREQLHSSQVQLYSWIEPCLSLAGDVSSVLNGKFPEAFSSWNHVCECCFHWCLCESVSQ